MNFAVLQFPASNCDQDAVHVLRNVLGHSARLLWHILRETLGKGAAACRPLLARQGLSESLVDPALALLHREGAEPRRWRTRAAAAKPERIAPSIVAGKCVST